MDPQKRFNVYQLLRHPFITGDNQYLYDSNNAGSHFEFNKKVDESVLTAKFISNNNPKKNLLSDKFFHSSGSGSSNNLEEIKIEVVTSKENNFS